MIFLNASEETFTDYIQPSGLTTSYMRGEVVAQSDERRTQKGAVWLGKHKEYSYYTQWEDGSNPICSHFFWQPEA